MAVDLETAAWALFFTAFVLLILYFMSLLFLPSINTLPVEVAPYVVFAMQDSWTTPPLYVAIAGHRWKFIAEGHATEYTQRTGHQTFVERNIRYLQ